MKSNERELTNFWEDDSIQFPRLIAEAEAAGLWTADVSVFNAMCESMDLEHEEVFEVISRAQKEWERIVENTSEYIKENNGIRL